MQMICSGFKCLVLLGLTVLSVAAQAAGGLNVTREVELNATPATVWKLVGTFNDLDVWHPAVVASELTGSGTAAGDKRVLTLGDGATITEKLVALNDADHSLTYAIETSPLPVSDYVSTLTVTANERGGSVVRWTSTFDAKDAPDEKATEVIGGIYDGGLGKLQALFN